MVNDKKIKALLIMSVFSFFIMSADFLIMPIGNTVTEVSMKWFNILTGTLFWGALICGIVLYILYSNECKKQYKNIKGKRDFYNKKRFGLISFFSNRYAVISDVGLFISILLFAILMIFSDRTSYLCYVAIMLSALFLALHCIFNGKPFCIYEKLNGVNNK